jgi:hypothetical protein
VASAGSGLLGPSWWAALLGSAEQVSLVSPSLSIFFSVFISYSPFVIWIQI